MASDNLTPSESAILIVLMAVDREIANSELKKRFGMDIRRENREKLNNLRYVASRRTSAGYVHVLDDKGWQRVQDDLDFVNPRARALGAALTLIHESLRERVLPRTGYRSFAELFSRVDIAPAPVPVPAPAPLSPAPAGGTADNLEIRLRNAYAALAAQPGTWVALSRLRPFFGDLPRSDVDEALRALGRAPDVNLVPENNQKSLTDADRTAAVHMGGQDKHLLAIGV